mgnify:FL=1
MSKTNITKVKMEEKWNIGYKNIIEIGHSVLSAFEKQMFFIFKIYKKLFWIELMFASSKSTLKIGIFSMFFEIGGGFNE